MPLYWSSISETHGRRVVYMTSLLLFVVFSIVSAISPSVSVLIVMRLLSSGNGCAVTVVGASVIADIWEVKERGRAMGIYYLGPLAGPTLGPVLGGLLTQKWNWRATQWFLAIYGGVILLFLFFCLPETKKHDAKSRRTESCPIHADMSRRSWHINTKSSSTAMKQALLDPLKALTYFRFPAIAIVIYLASITFTITIMIAISLQQTFSNSPYQFSLVLVGVAFLPMSIGMILGSLAGGYWSDRVMAREAKVAGRYDEKGAIINKPEDRMRENAWLSMVLLPGALLWYGWTAQKGFLWVVPVCLS